MIAQALCATRKKKQTNKHNAILHEYTHTGTGATNKHMASPYD
jgi:hypothetical protein